MGGLLRGGGVSALGGLGLLRRGLVWGVSAPGGGVCSWGGSGPRGGGITACPEADPPCEQNDRQV